MQGIVDSGICHPSRGVVGYLWNFLLLRIDSIPHALPIRQGQVQPGANLEWVVYTDSAIATFYIGLDMSIHKSPSLAIAETVIY